MPTNAIPNVPVEMRTRGNLARDLLAQVDRLAARLGDVAFAAELQLLKRELARGHAVLSVRHEDINYLSVVTLVEAALASITWKEYTPAILDALRRAFATGTGEREVTFEDYLAIRRDFRTRDIPTGPVLGTGTAETEDDGE